jgi:hypothetical protein
MNRLQSELSRLYLAPPRTEPEAHAQSSPLVGPSGRVRALVMELAHPPSWEVLSRVWRGVQTELGLPAPAVAVSGLDGLQLWFSLAEPIEPAQAHAFLACMQRQFLADIEPSRVRLLPATDVSGPSQPRHAALVPACQKQTGNWSAFLAPDLVPLFADSPWLDVPPNEEGQATLLHGIEVTQQAVFEAAFAKLRPSGHPPRSGVAAPPRAAVVLADGRPEAASASADAKRFLLQVMNDDTVALALRIEAAKALLQHTSDSRP